METALIAQSNDTKNEDIHIHAAVRKFQRKHATITATELEDTAMILKIDIFAINRVTSALFANCTYN